MEIFNIGNKVTWPTQSGGYYGQNTGLVVGIVPAGVHTNWHNLRGVIMAPEYRELTRRFSGCGSRDHESYLVAVRPGGEKSTPVLYWPRVKSLELVEGQ